LRTDFCLGSANLKEGSFEKYFRNISLMVTRAVGCYSNDI
jgi:predicted metal-binding protein